MSNRLFHTQRTANNGSVALDGFFTVTSGGGVKPTLTTEGRGVTCSSTGTGIYIFTLADKFREITSAQVWTENSNREQVVRVTTRVPSTGKITANVSTGNAIQQTSLVLPATASGASYTAVMGYAATNRTIDNALFFPAQTITADTTHFSIIKVLSADSTGLVGTWLATVSSKSQTLTARARKSMTILSGAWSAGVSIVARVSQASGGNLVPAGSLIVLRYYDTALDSPGACKLHYRFVCRNSTVK